MAQLMVGAFYNPHLGEQLAGASGIDHLAMADPPRADDPWWPKIRKRYTLLLHDYLGQLSEPLDEHAIARARSLAELYRSPWVAEHFQCLHTEDGRYNINYVFPPLYTEEFLERFVANAIALQARLDQPLVMENIPGFFDVAASQMPEPVWLRRFFEQTGAGFLLDLPHVWLEAHYRHVRPAAWLEQFPLDTLKMVGTLGDRRASFGLVQASDGLVHRVSVGNHLGQNYGRIVAISDSEIQLVEIIPDGLGGYLERPAAIALAD